MTFVSGLHCSRCGQQYPSQQLHNLCTQCQSPLLVDYDLAAAGHHVKKTDLQDRPPDMWRYFEFLPAADESSIVSLGEGMTPLVRSKTLGHGHDMQRLFIKDEANNPTGSFKARGLSAAVTLAAQLGATKLCIPTAGNAGGALAAYAAKAGLESFIFMPTDTPLANQVEAAIAGANVTLVEGLISDAGRLMAGQMESEGWFDVSTLKEPYRLEGKKTMGYELAEQFGWTLPDVILYPTGGGTGLIGMWKAFDEMEQLGWIDSRRPRMVAVQSEGCAPIVRAWKAGEEVSQPWEGAQTFSAGIRVPKAVGDFLILQALEESDGCAVAVSDLETWKAIQEVGRAEGLFLCPEGAACWAALKKLKAQDWVGAEETILVFNTGAGHKYIDALEKFQASLG